MIPRNNKTIPREHQGQLDHVISAKEIHEYRGRVLAMQTIPPHSDMKLMLETAGKGIKKDLKVL